MTRMGVVGVVTSLPGQHGSVEATSGNSWVGASDFMFGIFPFMKVHSPRVQWDMQPHGHEREAPVGKCKNLGAHI